MRIVRAKSFEDRNGDWQKIEVEMTSDDLLKEELEASAASQPTLLELRAELFIIASMHRLGNISSEEAQKLAENIEQIRLALLGSPALRSR